MFWLKVGLKVRALRPPRHIWFGVVIPVILVLGGTWRLWPLIEKYRGEEEREVPANLRLIAADAYGHTFKVKYDHYRYSHPYYLWSGDVAELAQLSPRHVTRAMAEADAAPVSPLVTKPIPLHGYYFLAIAYDPLTKGRDGQEPGANGSGLGPYRRSRGYFCAYPADYDWRHRQTFIINETRQIYSVDNGGDPVTPWPGKEVLSGRFTHLED